MRRFLNVVGGVFLGLTLSQYPEYTQQYEQRLGGAVDELQAIVTAFDAAAAREGLDREEALGRYNTNADAFIVGQGADMRATFERYEKLSRHLAALDDGGPFGRMTAIARYYDPQIAARTLENYAPAVPATTEGLAFAGAGVLGGYGLTALATAPFRRRRKRT